MACTTIAAVLLAAGCEREERGFRVDPPAATSVQVVPLCELQPGPPTPYAFKPNPFESNAQALSDGKRLFKVWNCSGCHANGGGGMGPALIDDTWIYGNQPEQIFSTIVQGRPNGMPSFGGRIADSDVWKLAAYVRSMSGLASGLAAPSRDDALKTKPPENSMPTKQPNLSPVPKTGEQP
ncbi:MAG TPA: c-type cytochrome [Humisphaera sp.]